MAPVPNGAAKRRIGRHAALLASAALVALALAGGASAQTRDPLVNLLVKKGVLTADDAAKLPPQPASPERDQLVKMLVAKGVLTSDDVISLTAAEQPIARLPEAAPPHTATVYAHSDHPTTLTAGPVDVTFSGFIDFDSIFRTTNTGNPGGTNFFAIPFSNTVAGNITELRDTAANSRLAINTETSFPFAGETVHAAAFVEADFLGNDAANVEVSSNSHTFRMRQAFVDLRRGPWEVFAGQGWGWLTPNRQGVDSYPADLFITNDYDFNYQVGLTWTRQPAFRVIYHPDDHWAMGVSFENPEQFGGQGEVTFPAAFNTQLSGQVDEANISSTPNLFPDIVPKIAYDDTFDGHKLHLEAAGLISFFKFTDVVNGGFVHHTATGYGVSLAGNVEIVPGLTAVANGYYSSGGGRYIFGMAPDIVVLPNAAGTDVFISTVKSNSAVLGLEWKPTPVVLVSGYYGFMHAGNDFAVDTTAGAKPGSFVGFGFPGSANTNNKWINEATFDLTYSIWTSPRYGVLQTGLQYSYMEREPWFVFNGAPANASLNMLMWDFRYTLP